jgi:hypothetical protein
MTDKNPCPCCGAPRVKYPHSFNAGLLRGLEALYTAGGSAELKNLGLSHDDRCNFQKLQHFGVVISHGHDLWTITPLGEDFIEGKATLPRSVMTYRNTLCGRTKQSLWVSEVGSRYKSRLEWAEDAMPWEDEA